MEGTVKEKCTARSMYALLWFGFQVNDKYHSEKEK